MISEFVLEYEQKHFSELERAMYEAWMRFLSEKAQVSDGFIFLENQAETGKWFLS